MAFHLVAGILIISVFDGTGDAGDSIFHYLYARSAPYHPELYFDHWAKPLYVLIASPFAQFGFEGVKFMNLILANLSLFFTYKLAKEWNLSHSHLAPLFLLFCPLFFVLTFSGLTEILFAFLLVFSLYLLVIDRLILSAIIISLLPFVRSEGLLFIGVLGVWFLYKKQFRFLPILLTGSLVYGIAGIPFHHDFLWVFRKVPYAKMSSTYGSGDPFHFVEQLIYVTGIPVYILFWLGILSYIRSALQAKVRADITLLLYGSVFTFTLAHSLFWYFGIFNSMGLNRVLISVLPLIAIIALQGFNLITMEIPPMKSLFSKTIKIMFIGYVVIFPFTSNPAAIDIKHDLSLNTDQKVAQRIGQKITEEKRNRVIITAHPYMCEVLEIDCFDSTRKKDLNMINLEKSQPGDLIVWESWFAVIEKGVSKELLDKDPRFEMLYSINDIDHKDRIISYVVYERVPFPKK